MISAALVTSWPEADDQPLYWWHIVDGQVQRRGIDHEPRYAAGLTDPDLPLTQITLVPSTLAAVRWHAIEGDLSAKQAAKAGEAMALADSIGDAATLHAAAAPLGESEVVTACVDRGLMAEALVRLAAAGIDPDLVIPAGLVVSSPDDDFVEADFGFEKLLRGARLIVPDEDSLRDALIAAAPVQVYGPDALDTAIALTPAYAGPNLRSGAFAKKARSSWGDAQKKLLLTLLAVVLILSLLVPVVRLAKLHYAASAAESRALAAARTIVPEVAGLAAAEQALDQKLAVSGRGNSVFAVPASGLFAAVQSVPQVAIRTMGYQPNAVVSARLTAPSAEAIDSVLATLSANGFTVAANPAAAGEGGTVEADITVRGF